MEDGPQLIKKSKLEKDLSIKKEIDTKKSNLSQVSAKPNTQVEFKPVFRAKTDRAKSSLSQQEKEEQDRLEKLKQSEKARERFIRKAESSKNKEKKERRDRRDDKKEERDRFRGKEERKREDADNKSKEAEKTEEELINELVTKHYLQKKESKRKTKAKDRYKFHFEWDDNDDTTETLDPLYSIKQKPQPMFGRGLIAGIDEREQFQGYKKFLNAQDRQMDEQRKKVMNAEKQYTETMLEAFKENPAQHWSEKGLDKMTERDWRIFKEDFEISTRGGNIPHPIRNWQEYPGLRPEIKKAIKSVGYQDPSPVQRAAIPIALAGRDLMGIAETGSGKTAAFVIPMLEYILDLPRMTAENEQDGPYAVILAPARELALQIEHETRRFAKLCGLRVVATIGGIPIEDQAADLRKGCEIVVATPGRLGDCLKSHYIVLNQCSYVVLDEADKMIELGFSEQVGFVLDSMPSSRIKSENEEEALRQGQEQRGRFRTTILYSATFAPPIQRMAQKYLRHHVTVLIGEAGRAAQRIEQRIEWVKDPAMKPRLLRDILSDESQNEPPIIIFVNKRVTCDTVSNIVEKLGFTTTTLHAGRGQYHREQAIDGFKNAKFDVLIATDLASRGLDVKGVKHVINYDLPLSIDNYTHRIGRTGRAGASGLATSFLTNEDSLLMWDLKQNLIATNNHVIPELGNHPAALTKPGANDKPQKRKDTVLYSKV